MNLHIVLFLLEWRAVRSALQYPASHNRNCREEWFTAI